MLSEPETKRLKTSPFPPFTAPEPPIYLYYTQLIYQISRTPFISVELSLVLAIIYIPVVSPLLTSNPAENPTITLQLVKNERKLRAARKFNIKLAYRNRPFNIIKTYKKAQSL
jgi:hypothetical protein